MGYRTDEQMKVRSRRFLAAMTVLAALFSAIGVFDRAGERYTDDGLTRALASFAVARGLNGVISAVQGTEVSFQPAGVGVTFAPGEILDPLNDMVERFSWVMLASSVSLGIQRLLLLLGSWPWFVGTASLLGVIAAGLLVARGVAAAWTPWFVKAVWVLLFLRFAVPLVAIVNEGVYAGFLEARYQEASQGLEATTEQLREMERGAGTGDPDAGDEGLLDRAQRMFDEAAATMDVTARIERYKVLAGDASRDAVELIVIFVFQTLFSPLVFLLVLVGFAKALWRMPMERWLL